MSEILPQIFQTQNNMGQFSMLFILHYTVTIIFYFIFHVVLFSCHLQDSIASDPHRVWCLSYNILAYFTPLHVRRDKYKAIFLFNYMHTIDLTNRIHATSNMTGATPRRRRTSRSDPILLGLVKFTTGLSVRSK